MIRNALRKIASIGLALCIMGTLMLSAPVNVMANDNCIAPFGIFDLDDNEED